MSAVTPKDKDERSLFEDASTLLMFSKARSDSTSSNHKHDPESYASDKAPKIADRSTSATSDESREHANSHFHSLPLTRSNTGNGTTSPRNPLASPGPASVALLEDQDETTRRLNSVSTSGANSNVHNCTGSSSRGMVAAAALAAAATVPLPLKTRGRRKNSHGDTDTAKEEEQKVKHPSKKKEWPVPDSYIVDLDSGVISCICGINDDDGFSIQCDHCNRWQHAICYNIKDIDAAPEEYLCNVCDPRKLDVKRAKRQQLERLKYLREHNHDDLQSSSAQFTYNDTEYNNNKINDTKGDNNRDTGSINDDSNNNNNNNNNNGNNKVHDYKNNTSNGDIRPQVGPNQRNQFSPKDEDSPVGTEDDHRRRRRREDEVLSNGVAKKRKESVTYMSAKEAYLAMYLPLETCEYKDKYVKMFIDNHSDDDWVIPYNKKTFKSLPLEIKPYSEVGNAKIFPGFTKLGVYLTEGCEQNDFISEFLGEVYFQKEYLSDPRNHYRIWGAIKPRLIFHPHWPLCIDARLCGNITRYIRRCCDPNVELATIRMPSTNEVKFVLRATRKIERGEEIYINWQWDLRHPILQIINGTATFESLNDPDKYLLIHSIHTVLGSCDCACGNSKDCYLLRVKKFSQTLYKSVKSKMNNRYKLNEILNQYQGKRRRPPPILTRLAQETAVNQGRATKLLTSLNAKKLTYMETGSTSADLTDKSNIGEGSDSSKEPLVKPLKWKLLERTRKNLDASKSDAKSVIAEPAVITDPSQYDESKVDDLDSLPIPIVLEVPLNKNLTTDAPTNYTTGSSQSIYKDGTSGIPPPLSNIAAEKQPQSIMNAPQMVPSSICRTSKLDDRSASSSAASLSDLSDHNTKPLKKKLSFADYRKKQSK